MPTTSFRPTRKALAALYAVAAIATTTAGVTASSSQAAGTRPVLKVPFPCQQTWRGNAWVGHDPALAIDFNQGSGDSDKGMPVKASASGTVLDVTISDAHGYGNRVLIGHGDGWRSFYAHLEDGSITVREGDHVTETTTIGKVGKSGQQEYSHLHYEQRLYNEVKPIRFGTSTWVDYGTEQLYTRTNC
jgi:hypothetical protein